MRIADREIMLVTMHMRDGYKTLKPPVNMNIIGIMPNNPSIIIYKI